MKEHEKKLTEIAFFGHFDATNLGNESTFQAILHNLRYYQPDAIVTCISTGSENAIAASHKIEAIPISENLAKAWVPGNRLLRLIRRLVIGIPSEPYRWIADFMRIRRVDILIVAGTGLLTDAYGLGGFGPYNLFRWSLTAKICGCKLFFVSVGAGPIKSVAGKWLVKSALSLADFRSYRDDSTVQYLNGIGFHTDDDRVYPDLAFSLPKAMISHVRTERRPRTIVGLGVMSYSGMYKGAPSEKRNGVLEQSYTVYDAYLASLADLTRWLLARESDVRLLIGDLADVSTTQEFKCLLRGLPSASDNKLHIIEEPIRSVDDLLSQIAATDIVVATRFHNVLLALLCEKPVISISFHHKCFSLMSAIGLSSYCLDINNLQTDRLIEKFCHMERNADSIKTLIRDKLGEFREALDEQYRLIFDGTWPRPSSLDNAEDL
jgi:polysaccharide pyruvyl transferase WcaK-like protein